MASRRAGRRNRQADSKDNGLKQLPFETVRSPLSPVKLISDDQIEAIHDASLTVLEQTGIEILSALQAYSLRLYDGLADEVGQDVGSHVVGGFFLAQTKERMEEFKHLAGKFKSLGLEYELVTPAEIKAKYPLLNVDDLEGGAWDPEEGYVDPYSVTMGLAAAARKYGGRIRRETEVEALSSGTPIAGCGD